MYCPMPSDDFIIVKKSGSQAGIEPIAKEVNTCICIVVYIGQKQLSRVTHNNSLKLELTSTVSTWLP